MEVLRRQTSVEVERQMGQIRESVMDHTFEQIADLAEKRPSRKRSDAEREDIRCALALLKDLNPRDGEAFAWKRGLRDLAKALDCSYQPTEDGCEIERAELVIRLSEGDDWTVSYYLLPARSMSHPLRALFKRRIVGGGADAIAGSMQKSMSFLPNCPLLDCGEREKYADLMHAMEAELIAKQAMSDGSDYQIFKYFEATALTPFTVTMLSKLPAAVGACPEQTTIGALIENNPDIRCSGHLCLEKSNVMNPFPSGSSVASQAAESRWHDCALHYFDGDDGLEAMLAGTISSADRIQLLPVHFSLRLSNSVRIPETLLEKILSLDGMISANVVEKTESPLHGLKTATRSQHPLYCIIGIPKAMEMTGEEPPWLCVDSIQFIRPEAIIRAVRLLSRQLLLNSLLDSLIKSLISSFPAAKETGLQPRASIEIGTLSLSDSSPAFTITLPAVEDGNAAQIYTLYIGPSRRPIEVDVNGIRSEDRSVLADELIEHLSIPRSVRKLRAEMTGEVPPPESAIAPRITSLWKRLELFDRPAFSPTCRRKFVVEKQEKSLSLLRSAKEVEPVGDLIPPLSVSCYFPRHQALRQMASMADISKYLRATPSQDGGAGEGALARSLSDLVTPVWRGNNMPQIRRIEPMQEAIARMGPSEEALQSFTQQMALSSPSSSAASLAYRSSLSMDAQPQLMSPASTADQAAFRRRWMQPQLSEHFRSPPTSQPQPQMVHSQVFDFVPDSQLQQAARQRMNLKEGMEEIPPHYVDSSLGATPSQPQPQPQHLPRSPSGKRGRGRRAANVSERSFSMGSMERSDTSSPLESPSLVNSSQQAQEGVTTGTKRGGRGGAGRVRKPRKSSNVSQLSASSNEQHHQTQGNPAQRAHGFPTAEFGPHDAVYQASRQASFKLLSPTFMTSSNEDQRLMELGMLPESSDDEETDPPPPRAPPKRLDGLTTSAHQQEKGMLQTPKQSISGGISSIPITTASLPPDSPPPDAAGGKVKRRNSKDYPQALVAPRGEETTTSNSNPLHIMMSQGGLEAEHIEDERELTPTTTTSTACTTHATSLSQVMSEMKMLKAKRLAKSVNVDTLEGKSRAEADDLYDSEMGEEGGEKSGRTNKTRLKEKSKASASKRKSSATGEITDPALKVVLKLGKLASAVEQTGTSKSCSPSLSSSSSLTQIIDEQRVVVATAVAKSAKKASGREGSKGRLIGGSAKRAPSTSLDDNRAKKLAKKESISKTTKEKGGAKSAEKPAKALPQMPEIPGIPPPLFTSLKGFKIPKVVETIDHKTQSTEVELIPSTSEQRQHQSTIASADNSGDRAEMRELEVGVVAACTSSSQSPRPRPADRPYSQQPNAQRIDERSYGKRTGPYPRRRSPPRNAPRFAAGRRDSPSFPHGDRKNTPPQNFIGNTAHQPQYSHDPARSHQQQQQYPAPQTSSGNYRHSPRGDRWAGPPQQHPQQQHFNRGSDSWISHQPQQPHQPFPNQQQSPHPGGGGEFSLPPQHSDGGRFPQEPQQQMEQMRRQQEQARQSDTATRSNFPDDPLSPTEEQLRIDEGE